MRSEDLAFVKVYLSKCERVYYDKNAYYYYVQHNKSIMHNKKTLNIKNNIEAFNYIKNNTENNDAVEMIFIREYLYLIENKETYLKGDSNENIDFMIYEYTEDDTIKHEYINMDLVVSKKIDGHFQIVDFKNNKVVFDTTKININNEVKVIFMIPQTLRGNKEKLQIIL